MITVVLVVTVVVVTTQRSVFSGLGILLRMFSQISSKTVITTLILHRDAKWLAQGKLAFIWKNLNPKHSGSIFCTLNHYPANPNNLVVFFWITNSLWLFILKIYLPLLVPSSTPFVKSCSWCVQIHQHNIILLNIRPELWPLVGLGILQMCFRLVSSIFCLYHPGVLFSTLLLGTYCFHNVRSHSF